MEQQFVEHKVRALDLVESAGAVLLDIGDSDASAGIARIRARLTDDRVIIAVAGECKRGKSALVNNLLREKLCPVDVDVTTCVATSIRYAADTRVTVIARAPDGTQYEREIGRDEIPHYVAQQSNPNNREGVLVVDVAVPNPVLAEGLVLVDTPGIGGLNPDHTAITLHFVPNADVVLYVFSATDPIAQSDAEFIGRILEHCPNLAFAMTRKDLVADPAPLLEENRAKIARLLDRPVSEVRVVAVNNLAQEAYLQSGDAEDLQRSNFEELQGELRELLTRRRGSILVGRALVDLSDVLEHVILPLSVEVDALRNRTSEVLNGRRQALEQGRLERERLLASEPEWSAFLARELAVLRLELDALLKQGFSRMRQTLRREAAVLEGAGDSQRIAATLNTDAAALSATLHQKLNETVRTLYEKLARETNLGVAGKTFRFSAATNIDGVDDEYDERPGFVTRSVEAIQAALLFSAIGGPFLIFGPAAALIAGAIGAIHGFRKGMRTSVDNARAAMAGEVVRFMEPQIEQLETGYAKELSKLLVDVETDMRGQLRAQIKHEQKLFDDSIAALDSALRTDEESGRRRLEELERPLARLRMLDESARALHRLVVPRHEYAATGA